MEKLKLPKLYRSIAIRSGDIDEEKRTVDLSFSSEEPYERWFGNEILGHSDGEVDMTRLMRKAPLLDNHDSDKQIGVIESAQVIGGKGLAKVRFSKNPEADAVFKDVVDGIKSNVSVGYEVNSMDLMSEANGVKTYRATKWTPAEVSIVSMPADTTVGVGRSDDKIQMEVTVVDKRELPTAAILQPMATEAPAPKVEVIAEEARKKAATDEKSRIKEISKLGRVFKLDAAAEKAIEDNLSIDEFRAVVLDHQSREAAKSTVVSAGGQLDVKMPTAKAEEYSLVRAIRESVEAQEGKRSFAGMAPELSKEIATKTGRQPKGFFIPDFALTRNGGLAKRDLSTLSQAAGAFTVESSVLGTELVDILRHRMYVMAAGARYLGGLSGNVLIPKQTGPGTAYWLAENASVTESDQVFGQFVLSPHTLMAQTAYSKQLLAQSSIDVEGLVRNDLNQIIAIALDLAALSGSGAAGQPQGIFNYTNLRATDITFGGSATWGSVIQFETNVSAQDADVDNMAFITSPAVRGKWKTTTKAVNYPSYLWESGAIMADDGGKATNAGEVNGYRAFATNQLTTAANNAPANGVVFGNWNDMIIANWAGIDVVTDPYTKASTGEILVTIHAMYDIGVRRGISFCCSTDSGAQ